MLSTFLNNFRPFFPSECINYLNAAVFHAPWPQQSCIRSWLLNQSLEEMFV